MHKVLKGILLREILNTLTLFKLILFEIKAFNYCFHLTACREIDKSITAACLFANIDT